MENFINWFEIPATDFARAVTFYQTILDIHIHEIDMMGTKMGLFPNDETNVSGAVVSGEGLEPGASGTLVYLNGGTDLQQVVDKIEAAGGRILVPKTEITPEMGYFAHFIDTEGNRMGLHSMQ